MYEAKPVPPKRPSMSLFSAIVIGGLVGLAALVVWRLATPPQMGVAQLLSNGFVANPQAQQLKGISWIDVSGQPRDESIFDGKLSLFSLVTRTARMFAQGQWQRSAKG